MNTPRRMPGLVSFAAAIGCLVLGLGPWGCVADELKFVGAYQDGNGGGSGGSGGGQACTVDSDCPTTSPCEVATCEASSCVAVLDDSLCPAGKVCTVQGCAVEGNPCTDRYPGALICDGFEDGLLDPGWIPTNVKKSDTMAFRGQWSLEIETVSPADRSTIALNLDQPILGGRLSVRTNLFLPAGLVIDPGTIHYELMKLPAEADQRMSLDLRQNDGLQFVNRLDDPSTVTGSQLLPRERWVCIEARVELGDEGSFKILVDGDIVLANGPGIDTLPMEGISRINIGSLLNPQATAPARFFMDEVVVATESIGCD